MKRRGIATMVCVMLIGTTATILVAVTGRAQLEAGRTAITIDDAQASQLLRAGLTIAASQAKSGHPISGPVASPVGTIRLTWTETKSCTINVALPHAHRSITCQMNDGMSLRLSDTAAQ